MPHTTLSLNEQLSNSGSALQQRLDQATATAELRREACLAASDLALQRVETTLAAQHLDEL